MRPVFPILLLVLALPVATEEEVFSDSHPALIKAEDLPVTVKHAMERGSRGAAFSGIEKIVGARGKAVYTARYMNRKGQEVSIAVSEDGKVVRNGVSRERPPPPASTPP